MLPARVGLAPSYRSMARKMRISPGTIRNRLKALSSSGVLLGSSVYLNPNLLGLEGGAFAIEVSPNLSKEKVVEEMKRTEGMLFIHNFYSALVGIAFVYPKGSLEGKLDCFRATAGAGDGSGIFTRVVYPPCSTSPTEQEWKLIARLSTGKYKTYAELAGDLDVSIRTLKYRMSKILRARAVLSLPTMNYRAIAEGVPADVVVVFNGRADRQLAEEKILALLGDYLVFAGVGSDYMVYNLVLPGLSMAADLEESIGKIGGVSNARAELVREHIDMSRNIAKLIPGGR
jgi:hypothetical protein